MSWHTIAPASRLRVGRVLPFTVAGRLLAVGRTADGYFALDGICPHAGGNLGEGEIDGDCLICPIHGFAYELRTGHGRDDAATVRVHRVELDGDTLKIELPD
jgi:nitrite reductase (NADH) small subunit